MAIKGNNIIVYQGGTAIAGAVSNEVQSSADLIEKSSPTSGDWKEYDEGLKNWSLNLSCLVLSNTDVRKLLNVGNTYTLLIKERNSAANTGVTGQAILKVCKITATKGNLVQGSFQFIGNGELT